jgi:hypothetical protein
MKKITEFLDKASLWKIFIAFYLIESSMISFMFLCVFRQSDFPDRYAQVSVRVGLVLGLIFSVLTTLVFSEMRKSDKFWKKSREIESLVYEAKKKADIQAIFDVDYQELLKLSLPGQPHLSELKRIRTMLETANQFLN